MPIAHIALYCSNLEGMKTFFETHFQAVAGSRYHNPSRHFSSYFLQFPPLSAQEESCQPSCRLELMCQADVQQPRPSSCLGYAHLALSLGSREAVLAKTKELTDAGYPLLSGPRLTGDGYFESCLQGPENLLLELTV